MKICEHPPICSRCGTCADEHTYVACRMRERLKLLLWKFTTSYDSNGIGYRLQTVGSMSHCTNKAANPVNSEAGPHSHFLTLSLANFLF